MVLESGNKCFFWGYYGLLISGIIGYAFKQKYLKFVSVKLISYCLTLFFLKETFFIIEVMKNKIYNQPKC